MSPLDVADNKVADTQRASPAYVPPLQRTEGQPPPIAAHGGLSYMSFDRDGDAGTAVAIQDALAEIAEGEAQCVIDMIAKAPPGPIKTKWGLGFRDYDECLNYIRQSNSIKAPPGGVALPLPYTVRAADLLRRPVQRSVAGPGARRHCGNPAQEWAGQPAAGPLFPADNARCAAYRRVLPGPLAERPRIHVPARPIAGAPRHPVSA